jgi:hypothetical protein
MSTFARLFELCNFTSESISCHHGNKFYTRTEMSVQMSTFQPIPEAKSPLTKWFHDTFLIDINAGDISPLMKFRLLKKTEF